MSDPRVLRAIAHPTRGRILDELGATGPMRAADVGEALGIPANQASFHLRQLAKYGVIQPAPEAARDKRDRVWKLADERGFRLDVQDIEKQARRQGRRLGLPSEQGGLGAPAGRRGLLLQAGTRTPSARSSTRR